MEKHEHKPTGGYAMARSGGCQHRVAEQLSRAEFGRLKVVRCACGTPLGRVCPDCRRVY